MPPPRRLSLFVGVGIVSVNNLLIHAPILDDLSAALVPWWAVSTSDHLEHHKRLTTHWAAPTISIDRRHLKSSHRLCTCRHATMSRLYLLSHCTPFPAATLNVARALRLLY